MDYGLPPMDLAAEQAVLSAILLQPAVLSEVMTIVAPRHFRDTANQTLYEAILELDAEERPIDVLTIRGWLDDHSKLAKVGGVEYLAKILNEVPAITNVDAYAQRIRDKWRLRQLIAIGRRVVAEAHGEIDDIGNFIDRTEQEIFELSEDEVQKGPELAKDILRRDFADIKTKLHQEARDRIDTGFADIDSILVGLEPSALVIVAARPGVGKTALADQWLWNVASRGHGVALFSLEMPRVQQVRRILCQQARVDSRVMARTPEKLTNEDWSSMIQTAGLLHKLPLYIDDEPAITFPTLRAKCRRIAAKLAKQGVKLSVVAIDYLQLMGNAEKTDNREQQVSANSRNLKRLAGELGVCCVALSQLNRAAAGAKPSRPRLDNLRESGAIEQDADQVIFIHREDDKSVTSDIIVAKGRSYGGGETKVRWTNTFARFDTLEEQETEYAERW